MGLIHLLLHGIAGEFFQTSVWILFDKYYPKRYEAMGITLINIVNNLVNSLCFAINGKILKGDLFSEKSLKYSPVGKKANEYIS